MENIKLPESEMAEMKQFYQDEYERLTRRIQHISLVLHQLGIEPGEAESSRHSVTPAKPKQESRPAGTRAAGKKRTGRKSKWELLIMKRLRQLDKPVTYDELTDAIMTFSKLPESKRTSTKQAVVNVVFRLRSRDNKLDTVSVGTREKYIALKSWFENPGEIKKEYKARIELPEKKKKTKRGRKKAH